MSAQHTPGPRVGYEHAIAEIKAGRAQAHALWVLLSKESDRDGYAIKPQPWEGPGEYQHVTFAGDGWCGRFVRLPDAAPSLIDAAFPKLKARAAIARATGGAA